ncbi:hypothetical protein GCM10020220_069560 [Nonomuraea rubra]
MPITAEVPGTGFAQVTFAARIGDGPWRPVGTDDAPNGRTFRVFHDLRDVPAGMPLAYKAIVKDAAGAVASAAADATAGPEPAPEQPGTANRDWLVVHYQRADHDGWGLHLWGDAIADGTATDWASPRRRDGVDTFGAYWRVPLKNAELPLDYVIHRGDTKDPGADQHFTPAVQPEAYAVSGAQAVHPTRAAAENRVVLHYRRPDGNHDGWGLHVWGGAAEPTDWASPLPPVRADGFGAVFEVPLAEGAKSLSYIIHKGDDKDLPADQSLDVSASGHEVWRLAGTEGLVLPVPAATGRGTPTWARPGRTGSTATRWPGRPSRRCGTPWPSATAAASPTRTAT